MAHSAITTEDGSEAGAIPAAAPESLALVIAWHPADSSRIGEVAIVPPSQAGTTFVFGRGRRAQDDPSPRLDFVLNRAGVMQPAAPIDSRKLSRRQLSVEPHGTQWLNVGNLGRSALLHNGQVVNSAAVHPGDTLQLGQELLLVCVRRPAWVRSLQPQPLGVPFGQADQHGLVGESPAMWELRRQIAFVAPRSEHVLVLGESGTGKELVARAIHELSPRGQSAFISRNAATLPEGLVDAELFGHARNYPNAGMPERQGLIGQAAGSTLFLDEFAELPPALQTHLLRVLDAGEYQRLGDHAVRTSDFRLVAATNRPQQLRDDVLARFKLSLRVPGLGERIEDVPLLVVHLLRELAKANPDISSRIFPDGLNRGPRVGMGFVAALLRHRYVTHVRELERLLWDALTHGPEDVLDRPLSARVEDAPAPPEKPTTSSSRAKPIPVDVLEAALVQNDWNVQRTWRTLGLSSRHALARLIAKHGLRRPP